MPLNPLDWAAVPFLTLYAVLAIAAMIVSVAFRICRGRAGTEANDLSVRELAYLSGGWQRAADTVLVSLFEAGAATFDVKKNRIIVDGSAAARSGALHPYPDGLPSIMTRSQFHRDIRPALTILKSHLANCGLLLSREEESRFWLTTAIGLGAVVLLGIAKIIVGLGRDRPVGFLVVLVLLTMLFGMILISFRPCRTQAGAALIRQGRRQFSRAARAPLGPEMALAFALTGPAILAGTPYAAFASRITSSDGGGGGGDGGGSGCGGGGGGCGGCGA